MNIKAIVVVSQALFATITFAAGSSSGIPPAYEIDFMPAEDVTNLGKDFDQSQLDWQSNETLSQIPSRNLIRTPAGRTLIPLSPQNIRRLNVRSSVGLETSIITDLNEKFKIRAVDQKLIDSVKAAEVVERKAGK